MCIPKFTSLTAAEAREALHYDPETGVFTRLISKARGKAGRVAGSLSNGYVRVPLDRKVYKAHRLAWLYMTGEWPAGIIDHVDRNRSNNRWSNLREVTAAGNAQNASLRKDNKSGVKGVSWCNTNKKWMAQLKVNNRNKFLGHFHTVQEAAEARRRAEETMHPYYTRHLEVA